ncbi:MAG: sulfur carrier protein ThiS [Pyrinomonadaceae bacterium]
MRIIVNGEELETIERSTISALIGQLTLASDRLAVELNHEVVRRRDWPHTFLNEGDHLEIIHFVGGGHEIETANY